MRLANGEGDATYEIVKDYYGKVLQSSKDLKTSACTAGKSQTNLTLLQSLLVRHLQMILTSRTFGEGGRPHQKIRELLKELPKEVLDKFYGCGAPLPLGIDGLRVRAIRLFLHFFFPFTRAAINATIEHKTYKYA